MGQENKTYPRYVTVYDQLSAAIQKGEYQPGEQLPGENELARQFGVSRNTLRQALMLLHEDGYIYMRQGKGNFVHRNQPTRKESLSDLTDLLKALAIEPIEKTETFLEIRTVSPKNKTIFGLDDSRLLVLVEIVCYSTQCPIGCGLAFIPYDFFAENAISLEDMKQVTAFYNHLLTDAGATSESVLRIVSPREPVTQLMNVTSQNQLLMLDELIRDRGGHVVMTQKLFFQPSAYEFTLLRKK